MPWDELSSGVPRFVNFGLSLLSNKLWNQEPVKAFRLLQNRQCLSEEGEDGWIPRWNLSDCPFGLAMSWPCDSVSHRLQLPTQLCAFTVLYTKKSKCVHDRFAYTLSSGVN